MGRQGASVDSRQNGQTLRLAMSLEHQEQIALKVSGLFQKFSDGSHVLNDISFELAQAQILGIIGPSGSGKTTLLRTIDLLQDIDRGSIDYFSQFHVYRAPSQSQILTRLKSGEPEVLTEQRAVEIRKKIGFVFQGFNLWEDRSVLENLTLAPRVVQGLSRQEATSIATELCRQFHLQDKLKAKIRELSGGQKQRIAIIRALIMQPSLVLLDEVTSALDPILTSEVLKAIQELRSRKLTMIIVTHHLDFATKLCDRLLFLSGGRIVQDDTPEKLRACPATEEVSEFLKVLQSVH